jgi:hypothetical protein
MVLRVIRIVCYIALAVVGGATLVTLLFDALNLCPGYSANTGLSCGGAWYEGLANAAMGIVMMSLLTLVPSVLAIAGLIFALIDLTRRRKRAAAPQP